LGNAYNVKVEKYIQQKCQTGTDVVVTQCGGKHKYRHPDKTYRQINIRNMLFFFRKNNNRVKNRQVRRNEKQEFPQRYFVQNNG
jgi:hypothetical protein